MNTELPPESALPGLRNLPLAFYRNIVNAGEKR